MAPTTVAAVKTVLIADDTAFVRDRFQAALEGAGHRVVTVRTGPELLKTVRTPGVHFDLIVLDLRLRHGNRLGLLRTLQKAIRDMPPVLVFSGTIASAAEVRALASLGVSGYMNEYVAVQHIVPSLSPHLLPDENNRRSSPRVVLGISVSYRVGNTIASALTLNISQGGLAVRTANPLPVGSQVRTRFRLPGAGRELDIEARVAWADRRLGMGLQFTKVDPAAEVLISDFVHSHFFSNRKA
jgi:uncharacterized protein (TIGR02266 family)